MLFLKSRALKYSLLATVAVASMAYAVTQITIQPSITLSDGVSGHKPKIQRMSDGRLVVVYGDNTDGAGQVYDLKADVERQARDIYTKSCMPSDTVTCNNVDDWSPALNLSNSALLSSMDTAWKADDATLYPYPGDIGKPNIKTSGPVVVVTWVSKYCPDGDLETAGVQAPVQRAIQYLERDNRTIPFSCTWLVRSVNSGQTWSSPVQLSTGLRDAMQDASAGNYDSTAKTGKVVISWQEDPQGLQIGEADGPGDGASGAKVNGGTDVWFTYATVNLAVPSTPSDDFVVATPTTRLTDNWAGLYGSSGSLSLIYDGSGNPVDDNNLEKGSAGASRPNIGIVGNTAIVAWEETKDSGGLDEGKFIRYLNFQWDSPTPGNAGCVISDPLKNARRVRFLLQSPADAGPGGIQIGIFWKEGIFDKGGPSDIIVRRGMGGLDPSNMVPAVDAGCATSVYADAIALASARGENISSFTPTATEANLMDDTEANDTENALAHRGILRGRNMWIGYTYTSDLVAMWAQLDNYNFWLRKFDADTGKWSAPRNITHITDTNINVREPRTFGTPKSSSSKCPSGDPLDASTTDPTFCQNPDVIYVAWGTQTNVSPFNLEGPQDLGEYITGSTNAGKDFQAPVKLSEAQGILWDDEESAYESQLVTRPDGRRFYGVWNQKNLGTEETFAQYTSGDMTGESSPEPVETPLLRGKLRADNKDSAGAFSPLMIALLGLLAVIRRRRVFA